MISFFRRLVWLFLRRRKEADLRDELAFHVAEEAAEQESNGLAREDAQRAARLQFGNEGRVEEDVRSAWSWIVLEQLRQDLSYACRTLWRARGFTAGAIAVLALGVGANLTVLQIFDATVIHRYSIPGAETFVRFSRTSRDGVNRTFPSSAFEFYRANSRSLASLISENTSFSVVVDGTPARRSTFVSENYFSNVAVLPLLGRVFDQQDARFDSPAVALLSDQYWRAQFGGDPGILGRVIRVNDSPVQVVGVLPDNFNGLSLQQTDLWFPLNNRRFLVPGNPAGQEELFGKLTAGASAATASAELTALTQELARRQPRFFGQDDRIQADPLQESLVQFFLTRSAAIVIFVGMVFLVLLSACAHIGNILLARGLSRGQELAIRIAIGASRGRLIRQLLTENVLLAILGSAAGLFAGFNAARLIVIFGGGAFQVSIHWQTVVACVAMVFVSVFAFALPAARETTRSGFQTSSLSSRFVANQVSVSCVLLVVTGVLAASGTLADSSDLSFNYRNIIVVDPQLYGKEGAADALQVRLDALFARFSALPGVESATIATAVPLRGRVVDNFPRFPRVVRSAVAPSYFDVMRLSVVRGRAFLPGEQDTVIASASAARSLWPNQDPLGKLWEVAGAKRRVVGVVQDSGTTDSARVEAYLPISIRDLERCVLVLHTLGDPAPVAGMIPRAAAELDESVLVIRMSAIVDSSRQGEQTGTKIFGSIGVVGTALAAAGMFALMAFTVVQRRREIGIRIAIGATRPALLLGLLRQHAAALASGVAKGAFASVMVLLFVRAFVYPEPYVVLLGGFALGLVFISAVAVLATLIPALRALRIDPATALRAE